MSRFDCPKCKGSLRFRMLRHVPREDGRMAFACIHCGATLTYNRDLPLLAGLFYGTKLRSLVTFLVGMVLISFFTQVAGRTASFIVIALFVAILILERELSKKSAYEVIESPDNDSR